MSTDLNNLITSIVPVSAMKDYLTTMSIPVPTDETAIANLVVRVSGVKTQANVAVLVINLTKGEITSDQLGDILGKAFPDSKANGGNRHGKHYMSLARTGKLPGCLFTPAKENGPKAKSEDPRVAELEAKVAALEAKMMEASQSASLSDAKKILAGK